jgi:WD40 repeat-containing protein SMU1
VWKIHTGQCLRKLEKAHAAGITSLMFARDGTQLLTGSYDTTARCAGRGPAALPGLV